MSITFVHSASPHLLWSLEKPEEGEVVNQITVDPEVTNHALIALDRILELS